MRLCVGPVHVAQVVLIEHFHDVSLLEVDVVLELIVDVIGDVIGAVFRLGTSPVVSVR